ncbi:MAG: hypothetical protein QXU69_07125 [Thermofilaceae archaeon]
MDEWGEIPPIMLKVAAVVLAVLTILDLAWVGLLLSIASALGTLAPLLPNFLSRILSAIISVSTLFLGTIVVFGIASLLLSVFLYRFANRVEEGYATRSEQNLWIALLIVVLAFSILLARWYYAAAAAVALAGALLARTV